jgi:transposase-like protein
MTRGVAHPADIRAEVVAAVLAGTTIAQAARQYGLSKQTVSRWVGLDGTNGTDNARDLGELILELIADHITTIQAQLQATTRPEWLEKQPAAELAQLVAVERDTVLRLLAGLRPVERQPELGSATLAPGAADDAG